MSKSANVPDSGVDVGAAYATLLKSTNSVVVVFWTVKDEIESPGSNVNPIKVYGLMPFSLRGTVICAEIVAPNVVVPEMSNTGSKTRGPLEKNAPMSSPNDPSAPGSVMAVGPAWTKRQVPASSAAQPPRSGPHDWTKSSELETPMPS